MARRWKLYASEFKVEAEKLVAENGRLRGKGPLGGTKISSRSASDLAPEGDGSRHARWAGLNNDNCFQLFCGLL